MAISKVVYGNDTLIDISNDTVTANKLAAGYTAHGSDGTLITGTGSISLLNPGVDRVNAFCNTLPYAIHYNTSGPSIYDTFMTNSFPSYTTSLPILDVRNCILNEDITLYTRYAQSEHIVHTTRLAASINPEVLWVFRRSTYSNIRFSNASTGIYYAITDINNIVLYKGSTFVSATGTTIAIPDNINTENGIKLFVEGYTDMGATTLYLYATPVA